MTLLRDRFAPAARFVRPFATGATATLVAAALLAVPAGPAGAGVTTLVQPAAMAWTDQARPTDAFDADEGDLPTGAWRDADGGEHLSRAYVTFDVSAYRGKRIVSATGILRESAVTDCTRPRALEVWRVAPVTAAPTWAAAPEQMSKVGDVPTEGRCPATYLELDLAPTLQAAARDGERTVTLMVRVPQDQEDQVAAGRRVRDLRISVHANSAPDVPGTLRVDGADCRDGLMIGTATPTLRATVTDPDEAPGASGDTVTATFAYWPVDEPGARVEWTSSERYTPATFSYNIYEDKRLTHGRTYAFAVRAADRWDTSEWSAPCRFTVDTQRPGRPGVTSPDYPGDGTTGGPGIKGRFLLTPAAGDTDVVAYRYGETGASTEIAADADGSVTLTYAPVSDGPATLYVVAVDRTGNRSEQVTYRFRVRNTAPKVTDRDPDAAINEPRTLLLAPGMDDVVEYTYQVNDGPKKTVQSTADGTATVTVVPDRPGANHVLVSSRTSTGLPSGTLDLYIHLATEPAITSPDFPDPPTGEPPLVGEQVTFHFAPGMAGVTEYVWSIGDGEERVVRADGDGAATVRWTEKDRSYLPVVVRSRTASGQESESTRQGFSLTSHAPEVDSADYPRYEEAGGPGVPGTFTFRPAHAGVTGYVYRFGDDEPKTVDAGPDGTATVTLTPMSYGDGWARLVVREAIGDVVSDATEHPFRLGTRAPVVTSHDYPESGGGGPGKTGSFVLSSPMADVTSYTYRFGGDDETTVSAGPDGTAVISYTPVWEGGHYLHVTARSAAGAESGAADYWFYVLPADS